MYAACDSRLSFVTLDISQLSPQDHKSSSFPLVFIPRLTVRLTFLIMLPHKVGQVCSSFYADYSSQTKAN